MKYATLSLREFHGASPREIGFTFHGAGRSQRAEVRRSEGQKVRGQKSGVRRKKGGAGIGLAFFFSLPGRNLYGPLPVHHHINKTTPYQENRFIPGSIPGLFIHW